MTRPKPDELAPGSVSLPALAQALRWTGRLVWAADRRHFRQMIALQACGAGLAAAELLLARDLLSRIIEHAQATHQSPNPIWPVLAAVVSVGAALSAATSAQQALGQLLGERTNAYIERRILVACTLAPLSQLDDPAFHDRMMRMRSQGQAGPYLIVAGIFGLARTAMQAIALIVALVIIDPVLAPVVIAIALPGALVMSRRASVGIRFKHELTPEDRERGYLSALMTWRQHGAELRALDAGHFLLARHAGLTESRWTRFQSMIGAQLRFSLGVDLAASVVTAGALGAIVALSAGGGLSASSTAAAAAAVLVLAQTIAGATASLGSLLEASVFVGDVQRFLEAGEHIKSTPEPPLRTDRHRNDTVSFNNVSFTYPSAAEPALVNVTASFGPDEVVALVGENGSGKTTLAKLLTGLYEPTSGRIAWASDPTQAAGERDLRIHSALILQDFVRYALSAQENIAIGDATRLADERGVVDAAERSGADEVIRELRDGYATLLAPEFQGGTELSAGQWQRIALARGFFRDAQLIILDEPSATLDPRAEAKLFGSMRRLAEGRGVVLISHRFSTVRSADRILVMQRGQIVEEGPHDELMARAGVYAELYGLQAAQYADRNRASINPGANGADRTTRSSKSAFATATDAPERQRGRKR